MTNVGGVIFDICGTVLDYGSRGPGMAFVELFRRHGVAISEEEARRPLGAPRKDQLAMVLGNPEVAARFTHPMDLDPLFDELRPLEVQVLRDHGDIIPGVVELSAGLRRRGIQFANTTDFDSSTITGWIRVAEEGGYAPDAWVCPDTVGGGRPAPWMAFHAARVMGVYPMWRIVKVGDTLADIEEAFAAGAWAVSVVRHGSEVGLSQAVMNALPRSESTARIVAARERLAARKPHYIIDSTADLMPVIEQISWRISRGERP